MGQVISPDIRPLCFLAEPKPDYTSTERRTEAECFKLRHAPQRLRHAPGQLVARETRAALLQEYIGYIQVLAPGQAGKLEPGVGETTQAVRRRLTAAAEALGKELQVRRSANAVYFWAPDARRCGRPHKGPTA